MTNFEKWLEGKTIKDMARVMTPNNCDVCPCHEECYHDDITSCEDEFQGWAFKEVGDGKKLCEFCDSLELLKEYASKCGDIDHVYAVKIVDEVYIDGNFRGQSTYGSMALRFCPMCGKKLEDER